ncbi:hypothetical protein NLG97_g7951 [Lecanicillium saksenae]|uniref:Uncharacterized protein n=1 Tax=Lecanicillium saksenae TaxID=468837 RepID=A0ACC1QKC9_9HYPO|nr:hypothetical protein NLG97_g7951 [Lecanicillium saksenae]
MRCSTTLLLAGAGHALATPSIEARESKPKLPFDENSTPHCTWWLDYKSATPCADILSENLITNADFSRWNPTVGKDCSGMKIGNTYCVEAAFEPTVPTTTTTTDAPKPTPTKPSNGTSDGTWWSTATDSTLSRGARSAPPSTASLKEEFATWNPKVGSTCSGLWADTYACTSIIGWKPTPTDPGNGIQTPTPIQPDLVKNCNKFHYVKIGESCTDIASRYGISTGDFARWNPPGCLYHSDCSGKKYNSATIERVGWDGMCISTDCQVASLDIAAEGLCPDGQVQLSYWEEPGCVGEWYGYGYASRGTCRSLWSGGWKFKSLHLRCTKREDDCVSKSECTVDPEPSNNKC